MTELPGSLEEQPVPEALPGPVAEILYRLARGGLVENPRAALAADHAEHFCVDDVGRGVVGLLL